MVYYPLDETKGYDAAISELMQMMVENTQVKGELLFSLLRNLMQYLKKGVEWYNDLFCFELHFTAVEQAFLYVPLLQERGFNKDECEYVVREVSDWWESYQSVLLCTICDSVSRMKKKGFFDNKGKLTELRKSYEMGKTFNKSQKEYLARINMALLDEVNTNKNVMELAARFMFKSIEYLTGYKSIEYRIDAMQKMLMEVLLESSATVIGELISMA